MKHMEKVKRIYLTPNESGNENIQKAVEILRKEGKKITPATFCYNAAIEAATNAVKNSK